jgi:hypothetical protein
MGQVQKHGTGVGNASLSEHFKMNRTVGYSLTARLLICERKGAVYEGPSYDKTLLYHLM